MDAHAQWRIYEVKNDLVVYTIWSMSRMVFYYLDCFCDIWSAYLYTFCVLIVYIHILSFQIVRNSKIDCLFVCLWFTTVVLNLLLGNLKIYLRFITSSQHCHGPSRSYPSPMKIRAYLAYVNDKTTQGISIHDIDTVWLEYSDFHTRKLKLWDCCSGFISYQHVWIEAGTVSGAKSYMISCFYLLGNACGQIMIHCNLVKKTYLFLLLIWKRGDFFCVNNQFFGQAFCLWDNTYQLLFPLKWISNGTDGPKRSMLVTPHD